MVEDANSNVTETSSEGVGAAVELRVPQDAGAIPPLANYIISNVAAIGGERGAWHLTFVHLFPVPTGPDTSDIKGEVVARVTLSRESAESLKDLLGMQIQRSEERSEERSGQARSPARSPSRAARRSRKSS